MGFAPTWLRQMSPLPPASQNHFNHCSDPSYIFQGSRPPQLPHDIRPWLTCTIVGNARQVRLGVEFNRLIAGVVTRHVTFAAVYAHILRQQ